MSEPTELGPNESRRRVSLLGVPIATFTGLQRHFDDMVRELQLIEVGRSATGAAARLRELALFTHHDIARDRGVLHAQAVRAQEQGHTHVDLRIDLAPPAVADARSLVDLVRALDRQSRAGDLLTPPAEPVEVRLVGWIADQVEAQVAGDDPPTPFPG